MEEEENKKLTENIETIGDTVKNLSLENLRNLKMKKWNELELIKETIHFREKLDEIKKQI